MWRDAVHAALRRSYSSGVIEAAADDRADRPYLESTIDCRFLRVWRGALKDLFQEAYVETRLCCNSSFHLRRLGRRHVFFKDGKEHENLFRWWRRRALVDQRTVAIYELFLGGHFRGLGFAGLHARMGFGFDSMDDVFSRIRDRGIHCSEVA